MTKNSGTKTPARDPADPKGLVRESYRMDGISDAECRSILIDWALSLPPEAEQRVVLQLLLDRHADAAPDHPMTALLQAGLKAAAPARRRGGRAARTRGGSSAG